MTSKHHRRYHEDSGAAMLLAVGFVLMISAVAGGLASLATSSLNNRHTLELVRNREYAADGAIENAISRMRLKTTCAVETGSIRDEMNGAEIRVDWVSSCGTVQSSDLSDVAQRNVIFSASVCTASQCSDTLIPAGPVIIRARVNFQEDVSGAVTKTFVQSWIVNR